MQFQHACDDKLLSMKTNQKQIQILPGRLRTKTYSTVIGFVFPAK